MVRESVSEPTCAWHCSRCGVRTTNRADMGPALKRSAFWKSWASGLLLSFLSSRLFKALLTRSPQPSSLVFDSICWVAWNLLGSIGPSSGQREALWECTSPRMPLKHSSQSQVPTPIQGPVLEASPLADGWYPPGVKRGGAAGPEDRCVLLTLKRIIDQLTLPAEQCALRPMEHSQWRKLCLAKRQVSKEIWGCPAPECLPVCFQDAALIFHKCAYKYFNALRFNVNFTDFPDSRS